MTSETRDFWLVESACIIAAATFGYLLVTSPAEPHEAAPTAAQPLGWTYPWMCCSNQDCRRADGEVAERPEGYVIKQTGEVIPYADKRIKDSPDGEFHVCTRQAGADAGKAICLFRPPRGF